jgi:sugar fermentation stimulation protein A
VTEPAWTVARFLGREKRFTVHVELPDGARTAAHTNNTGRLTGCVAPGARCWLSPALDPRRKLAWTLEVSEAPSCAAGRTPDAAAPAIALDAPAPAPGQVLVGVNTATPSRLVAEAVDAGLLPGLAGCRVVRREARYPDAIAPGSRADLLLQDDRGVDVWVEIKNVTWVAGGLAMFPDAPTARGRKHLGDLAACVAAGHRAALVFCVQRTDADGVAAAASIDPDYARLLHRAAAAGVQCLGLLATVTPGGVTPAGPLPVSTDDPSEENAAP